MTKKTEYRLKDRDIRTGLIRHLSNLYFNDPDTRILREFNICEGNARIDIAVVNGLLIGYEIKSDSDTLERLPVQQEVYNQIFNRIIIVVGKHHISTVADAIPPWWGIWRSTRLDGKVLFRIFREAEDNPIINPLSLAECLWRDEALAVLRDKGLVSGLERAKRAILREKLASALSCAELNSIVCSYLKSRVDWSIVLPRE